MAQLDAARPRARGVVFDFYGTLSPGTTLSERDAARRAVADALGCDRESFAAAVRASFDERARGSIGGPVETMRWLARECGVEVPDDVALRAYERRLEVELPFMAPRAETIEVLAALRASGHAIGLLSDCTHELPQCWPSLPYATLVDAAVFSVETGMRKPDPAMYRLVCDRIGVAPRDCRYVGDGGSNELSGARAAGMRAIQLRGPEFASCHTYDAERSWDGEVITDLRELLLARAPSDTPHDVPSFPAPRGAFPAPTSASGTQPAPR